MSQPAVNKNEPLRLSTKVTMRLEPETTGLKAVSPKPGQSATVAADVTRFRLYPVDRPNYSNPLFPSGGSINVKESKPVQETDHETHTLYGSVIVTNVPAQHKSIFESSVQDKNRSFSNLYTSGQHLSERRQTYFESTTGSGTASQELYNQGATSHGKGHAGNDQGTLELETCKEAASQRNDPLRTMSQVSQSFGALSMDKRNIENYSASVMTSQVFQQLGYTELDVATARAELERKGNKSPTSEDIVNTILDIQERTSQNAESSSRGDNSRELKEMLEENERLSEIVYCKLCVTGEPDILFLSCAHHKICHNCAENLTYCPSCQKQIKENSKHTDHNTIYTVCKGLHNCGFESLSRTQKYLRKPSPRLAECRYFYPIGPEEYLGVFLRR